MEACFKLNEKITLQVNDHCEYPQRVEQLICGIHKTNNERLQVIHFRDHSRHENGKKWRENNSKRTWTPLTTDNNQPTRKSSTWSWKLESNEKIGSAVFTRRLLYWRGDSTALRESNEGNEICSGIGWKWKTGKMKKRKCIAPRLLWVFGRFFVFFQFNNVIGWWFDWKATVRRLNKNRGENCRVWMKTSRVGWLFNPLDIVKIYPLLD